MSHWWESWMLVTNFPPTPDQRWWHSVWAIVTRCVTWPRDTTLQALCQDNNFAKLTTKMTPPSLVSPLFSHRGLQQIYSCRHSHLTDNRHISRDKYLSHILSRHAGPERVCRAQSVRNVHGATSSSRLPGRGLVWVGYQRASLARIISCLQLTASRYWSLGRDSLVMDAVFWPGAGPRRTGPFIDWSHSHPGVTIKFHLDSRLW